MATDTRTENGVMYFDRSTYPESAHIEGQTTLDGCVWSEGEYKERRLW